MVVESLNELMMRINILTPRMNLIYHCMDAKTFCFKV